MANLTVTLPADLEAWVETQAQTTEFPSADAYLASLIRHDQERRQALAEIQALVTEGMESGISDLSMDQVRDHARRLARKKAATHAG